MRFAIVAVVAGLAGCPHPRVDGPHPIDEVDDRPDDGDDEPPEPPEPPRKLPRAALLIEPPLALATVAPGPLRDPPWPLTELPSKAPHLDAAWTKNPCTAQPGQHADVRAYLAAWCRIRAGEPSAIAALAPLARAARADVMRAARLDVIDLTAATTDAKIALARLTELHLADVETYEVLAGTYVALHARGQAEAVANALRVVEREPAPRSACERLLAWGAIDAVLRDDNDLSDPVCGPRAAAVACALRTGMHNPTLDLGSRLVAMRECFNELPDDPDRDRKLELVLAHARWGPRTAAGWLDLSRHAEIAIGLPGAEDFAVTALLDAVLASDCTPEVIAAVRAAVPRIAALPAHDATFDLQLLMLQAMSVEGCIAMHP